MQDEMSEGFQGFDGFSNQGRSPTEEDCIQASARLYALRENPKLTAQEREDLTRLISGANNAGMQMQVLEQQLQRQVTSGMFVVAGHIWAAMFAANGSALPVPSRVADIAADLVQEIYKR